MTIFSKIIQNPEEENYRILELNDQYLVMLSIAPETKGHTLVIPTVEVDNLSDLADAGNFFETTLMWANTITAKLNARAFTLKINNKLYTIEDNGHVNHLHFHIIPRYSKDDKVNVNPKRASKEELAEIKKLVS